ncbi:MAG: hypothetical protein WCV56_02900 [Candidatus Omnitrophota bacterium]
MFKMNRAASLYVLLIGSLVIQLFALKYFRAFPDLALMTAVFAGIFFDPFEAAALGLAAGFFRSCFASGSTGLDMVIFSAAAYISSLFSLMFYRRNPLFHVIAVLAASLFVLFTQAVYFGAVYDAEISFIDVLSRNKGQIFLTAAASPIIFPLWSVLLKTEE